MGALLFYIIKSTICLTVLYLLFRLFFRKDTLFRTNRLLLLAGTVMCMLLPLIQINIPQFQPMQLPMSALQEILIRTEATRGENMLFGTPVTMDIQTSDESALVSRPSLFSHVLLYGIYFSGMAFTFFFLLVSLFKMWRLIHCFPGVYYYGYKLVIFPQKISSFSWGNTIVLSQEDYEKSPEEILMHERMHLQHHHTWDLVWMEIIAVLHWFNPAVWLLIRELRDIHEYEADEGVLCKGIDATQYQLLLVKKSVGSRLYSMACGFNHSKLKKRINMMLKKRTKNWARLKLLLFVPVAAGTLYAFAQPEVNEAVGQIMPAVVNPKDSLPTDELEQLMQFFEKKKSDALGENNLEVVMSGNVKSPYMISYVAKKNNASEKKGGTDTMRKNYPLHTFFINLNNKMMLDNEYITMEPAEVSKKIENILRKDYKDAVKNKREVNVGFIFACDRGSDSQVVYRYLNAVKDAYLQVRKEISQELGGVDETRLNKALPIMVFFNDLKKFGKSVDTNASLPIEVRLVYQGEDEYKILKDISLDNLYKEIIAFKKAGGDKHVLVSTKRDKNLPMGIVFDVKETIKKATASMN